MQVRSLEGGFGRGKMTGHQDVVPVLDAFRPVHSKGQGRRRPDDLGVFIAAWIRMRDADDFGPSRETGYSGGEKGGLLGIEAARDRGVPCRGREELRVGNAINRAFADYQSLVIRSLVGYPEILLAEFSEAFEIPVPLFKTA